MKQFYYIAFESLGSNHFKLSSKSQSNIELFPYMGKQHFSLISKIQESFTYVAQIFTQQTLFFTMISNHIDLVLYNNNSTDLGTYI